MDERNPEDGSGDIAFVPWATHHQLRMGDRDTQRGTLRLPPCSAACRRTVPMDAGDGARLVDGLITCQLRQRSGGRVLLGRSLG